MTFRVDTYGGLAGQSLPKGKDKHDKEYARSVQFKDGYSELARIVAGLGKEVKRINQCLTLQGAQQYVSKKKNWTAHEADITGKNGIPDGVKEVFVCDSKGNLKIINGYGLEKSEYPWRKAYRETFPTRADRKDTPYGTFKDVYTTIHEGWDANGSPYYEFNLGEINPEYAHVQPEIKPKDLYKQFIYRPIYDTLKEQLKTEGVPPMMMARIFNKILTDAYNRHVKFQVAADYFRKDPSEVEEKERNRFYRSADYKLMAQQKIKEILSTADNINTCRAEIDEIIGSEIDEIFKDEEKRQQARAQLQQVAPAHAFGTANPERLPAIVHRQRRAAANRQAAAAAADQAEIEQALAEIEQGE